MVKSIQLFQINSVFRRNAGFGGALISKVSSHNFKKNFLESDLNHDYPQNTAVFVS